MLHIYMYYIIVSSLHVIRGLVISEYYYSKPGRKYVTIKKKNILNNDEILIQ